MATWIEALSAESRANYHVVTLDPTSDPPSFTVSMRDLNGDELHRVTLRGPL